MIKMMRYKYFQRANILGFPVLKTKLTNNLILKIINLHSCTFTSPQKYYLKTDIRNKNSILIYIRAKMQRAVKIFYKYSFVKIVIFKNI